MSNNSLERVKINNEQFFKIADSDLLRPFFMSIVSDSDHWLFISSNGGLTAGRRNAQYSLFPYYTDDKITESVEVTGSKSIFRVEKNRKSQIWEPFSIRYEGRYQTTRNLYKNIYGNKVIFEEDNHDLQLRFQYEWSSSHDYGWVRKAKLTNYADETQSISLLDGLQNILPAGVGSDTQNAYSNLLDAYKRSELEPKSGLGIYALSATLTDKAEPSEALKANTVWSVGLEEPTYLVSSLQVKKFRKGMDLQAEQDVKAEKGAYFVHKNIELAAQSEQSWMIVADLNKSHAAVAQLIKELHTKAELEKAVHTDIEAGTQRLISLNAAADGLQSSSDTLRDTRHFSNTLFNIMRGGIFDENYQIERQDFSTYLSKANKAVYQEFQHEIAELPKVFSLTQLKEVAQKTTNPNFKRLCLEYMPLKFSRRHGDPSRPWNKFSINTRSEVDGSKILDYQGNWRDIFQNWEALAHSYPEFMESMIHKFLNASTFDGYNPYRVTKDGFDWETIEPDDPWSYIGYWGDHQIIYLLKFLEFSEKHAPGQLEDYFNRDLFVYANVPYKIKPYQDILDNPKDTIDFDAHSDEEIRAAVAKMGADGALLKSQKQGVYQVNFIEKILATTLAKLSNFILEGGIWMNTQRPEWNDANNALVGNGVSMVTLYYLRRFQGFFSQLLGKTETKEVQISTELADFYQKIQAAFQENLKLLSGKINDEQRKTVLDALGTAASDYRNAIYQSGFSGEKKAVSLENVKEFADLTLKYIDHSIEANKRADDLYHAYNLMTVESPTAVSVSYLSEMLEGQVAVLSAGYLTSEAALAVLDGLKKSALFREDQYSYILYPNKILPGFLEKNSIPKAAVESTTLLQKLVETGNVSVVEKDVNGAYHFNGNFKNANDLKAALAHLEEAEYGDLVQKEQAQILQIFENVFNHKAFTGRSGTFYGYEGLGSIYWHMVSKLSLAVQECCLQAIEEEASAETIGRLLEHYYEINEGIGVHKPPSLYGAFPTDPYSHTPGGKGAQQPGMTGQVKEDILCRFGELGVKVENGQLCFQPTLLRKEEFLSEPQKFHYVDVHSEQKTVELAADNLSFTYCQVPVVYEIAEQTGIEVIQQDGTAIQLEEACLEAAISQKIFQRTGEVQQINVRIKASQLR